MLITPRRGHHAQELPARVRSKVLDLLKADRTVVQIAHDLQISDQTICTWHRQSLIGPGQGPGLTSVEKVELASARRRIAELETELAIHQRAAELLKEVVRPKARFTAITAMAQDGMPIQTACRVLGVSESGLHAWRGQAPSARSVQHAWLTDLGTRIESLRFLLRDRNAKYGQTFDIVFHADDLRVLTSVPQAPRMNAHCEQIIGTIRRELLDHILITG